MSSNTSSTLRKYRKTAEAEAAKGKKEEEKGQAKDSAENVQVFIESVHFCALFVRAKLRCGQEKNGVSLQEVQLRLRSFGLLKVQGGCVYC